MAKSDAPFVNALGKLLLVTDNKIEYAQTIKDTWPDLWETAWKKIKVKPL